MSQIVCSRSPSCLKPITSCQASSQGSHIPISQACHTRAFSFQGAAQLVRQRQRLASKSSLSSRKRQILTRYHLLVAQVPG
ncbi:hypothetical protein FGO68_gene16894 [Halteria grandinella]|uniref:Uncharacterized protein n=1 Tax=Halteria grandinella TaxID=5974 RepID=A0A8J8P4N7_HALGN|nr:hypothetical protein FGO68_gene16894 [Halteria grandinella]